MVFWKSYLFKICNIRVYVQNIAIIFLILRILYFYIERENKLLKQNVRLFE